MNFMTTMLLCGGWPWFERAIVKTQTRNSLEACSGLLVEGSI